MHTNTCEDFCSPKTLRALTCWSRRLWASSRHDGSFLLKVPKSLIAMTGLLLFGLSGATTSHAQDETVTLRVHHFLSSSSTLHEEFLVPFAERLEEKSDGAIHLEIFPSLQLGGGAADLYDQAADGAVDIVMALPGYTPGRFERVEVFELPFMMDSAHNTSAALWDFIESDLQDTEFRETKIIAAWVHGPGVLHTRTPVRKLEDLRGLEVRGPTRIITGLLRHLGATPVGMPLPKVPESISKGVVQGAVVPWDVVPSLKLQELVGYHTELPGERALYTAVLVLAMNWDSYEAMPANLRAIFDEEIGKKLSVIAGGAMDGGDERGRESAMGNEIIILPDDEVQRWIEKSQTVYEQWIDEADERGFDGQAVVDHARALIRASR